MITPTRPLLIAGAALVLGAGGGAGVAVALDHSTTTIERVTTPALTTRSAAEQSSSALTVNEIYRRSRLGVVDIKVTGTSGGGDGPFGQGGATEAEGTGFVIDRKGDIVTNQHVVSGADTIKVTFADGRQATARVVGEDPSTDVAVIHVDVPSSELHPLTFGDSSAVQVGDGVVAIGNPYGLTNTVTTGVVSALGRSISAPNHYTIAGAIQTDAAINHGNSGGPLLDSSGHVIGMNAQIESDSGDSNGLGFAIASDTVRRVAQNLVAGDKVSHPYLGVSLSDGTDGASIASVRSGSPADKAGLRSGDLITAIDGHAVTSADDATGAIASHAPGDKLTLTIRRAGTQRTVTVALGDRSS
jgi:putative serine protease PepD